MVKQATSGTVNILFVLFVKFYNCGKQTFDLKKNHSFLYFIPVIGNFE